MRTKRYVTVDEFNQLVAGDYSIDEFNTVGIGKGHEVLFEANFQGSSYCYVVYKKLETIFDDFPLPWSANALMVRAANDNWVIHIGGQHQGKEPKQLEEIIRVIVEGVNAKYGDNKT